jgi:hypothetical protein
MPVRIILFFGLRRGYGAHSDNSPLRSIYKRCSVRVEDLRHSYKTDSVDLFI